MKNPSRIFIPLLFGCHALLVFTLLRVILFIQNWPSLPHHPFPILKALLIGFRMDIAVMTVLVIPFLLYSILIPEKIFKKKWHLEMLEGLYVIGLYLFIFLNAADYFFFDEFNARFNYIAIDYLATPTEVLGNIWQSYPVPMVIFFVAVLTIVLHLLLRRLFYKWAQGVLPRAHRVAAPFLVFFVAIVTSRTVNIRMLSENPNRILAEIGANGFYTLGYALLTNHLSYNDYYQTMDSVEAFAQVKKIGGLTSRFLFKSAR